MPRPARLREWLQVACGAYGIPADAMTGLRLQLMSSDNDSVELRTDAGLMAALAIERSLGAGAVHSPVCLHLIWDMLASAPPLPVWVTLKCGPVIADVAVSSFDKFAADLGAAFPSQLKDTESHQIVVRDSRLGPFSVDSQSALNWLMAHAASSGSLPIPVAFES